MSRGKRHRQVPTTVYPRDVSYPGTMSSWQPILGGGGYWKYTYPYGYMQNWPITGSVLRNYAECWDEVHKRRPGSPYREGGPLFIRRSTLEVGKRFSSLISHINVNCEDNPVRLYQGLQIMPPSSYIHVNDVTSRVERASTYGAQAWRMFTPDKPAADLSQFWVELRDLRSQFNPVEKSIKGIAGGYLNLEFGWVPFLGDIVKLIKCLSRIDAIVTRLIKYNGKWQKRKGVVAEEKEHEEIYQLGNCIQPVLTGEFYPPPSQASTGQVSISTRSKTWFEAQVRFYIPDLETNPTMYQCTKLLARIVGLDFTKPLLYWQIFPYSWLVDWVGNMSSLIKGMETLMSNELIARYAYVMDERVISCHQWQVQPYKCNPTIVMHTTYDLVSKERADANPLGFGPLVLSLTPKRLAILAALGLQGNFGHF